MFQRVEYWSFNSFSLLMEDCASRHVVGPGTTSYHFHAGNTVSDPHSSSFHLSFATEGPSVLSMLAYFNFLHHFPDRSTITGPVFTDDSNFLAHLAMSPQTRTEPREHPPPVFVKFYWNTAMSSHS